jgi:cob(I)alamin adenosyltransferase
MLKDQSVTCLGSRKIKKSAPILGVLGDLDELTSLLGLVRAFTRKRSLQKQIISLQEDLILIGGWLSGQKKTISFKEKTLQLEAAIKKSINPSLKKFSRPGVNQTSAFLHLSRATARKLERKVVGLRLSRYQPLANYLNRFSALLFWLAVKEEKV